MMVYPFCKKLRSYLLELIALWISCMMLFWTDVGRKFSLKGAVNFSESDVCHHLQEAFLKVKFDLTATFFLKKSMYGVTREAIIKAVRKQKTT